MRYTITSCGVKVKTLVNQSIEFRNIIIPTPYKPDPNQRFISCRPIHSPYDKSLYRYVVYKAMASDKVYHKRYLQCSMVCYDASVGIERHKMEGYFIPTA